MRKFYLCILAMWAFVGVSAWPGAIPKLKIGMNLSSVNYYTTGLVFTDVMTTSDFRLDWAAMTGVPVDTNGYPTQIPYAGQGTATVRFLISNYYKGRYVVLYDGAGTLSVHGVQSNTVSGKLYMDLTGAGGNIWIDITASTLGNHIRNIRIVPEQYNDGSVYPTFRNDFLDGLRPFHAVRFMDWLATNGSQQMA